MPNTTSRSSLAMRSASGSAMKRTAPITGPSRKPAPPRITIMTRLMLSSSSKESGAAARRNVTFRPPPMPAIRGRDGEDCELVGEHIDAARGGDRLVLADRGQRAAEIGADDQPLHEEDRDEHGQRQPVEALRPAEIDHHQSEVDRLRPRNAGQPLRATGQPVEIVEQRVEDHADRQGHDDEEVAAQPQAGQRRPEGPPFPPRPRPPPPPGRSRRCRSSSGVRSRRRRRRRNPCGRARPARYSRTAG